MTDLNLELVTLFDEYQMRKPRSQFDAPRLTSFLSKTMIPSIVRLDSRLVCLRRSWAHKCAI